MVLTLCFLTLLTEAILNYIFFDRSICSPSFILCTAFTLASADLITMYEYWDANLHWNTYFVICGGCLLFSVVCYFVKFIMSNVHIKSSGYSLNYLPRVKGEIEISQFKLFLILAFNSAVIVLVAYKVIKIARHFGMGGSILGSFGAYAELSKFSTKNTSLGKLALLYNLCKAGGYIWGNMFIMKLFKTKKVDLLLLGCYFTALCSTFITGSRGGAAYMIMSLIPSIYLCRKKQFVKKPIKKRYFFFLGIVGIGVLLSFKFLGSAIGRDMKHEVSAWTYASIYLGAPIKNLDYFLQRPHNLPKVFGCTTFYYQIQSYAIEHDIKTLIYEFDLPFMSFNGHNSGNVFTMFYTFVYDFGYKGVVILTSIMAFVLQVIYESMIKSINKPFSFSRLLYMYEFPFVVFAFFSNKFYEGLTTSFLKIIFFWIVIYILVIQNTYKAKK